MNMTIKTRKPAIVHFFVLVAVVVILFLNMFAIPAMQEHSVENRLQYIPQQCSVGVSKSRGAG